MTLFEFKTEILRQSRQLIAVTDWDNIVEGSTGSLDREVRSILNKVERAFFKYTNDTDNFDTMSGLYNDIIGSINKTKQAQALNLSLNTMSKREAQKVSKPIIDRLLFRVNKNLARTERFSLNKIRYIKKLENIAKKTTALFRVPRITLLQAGMFVEDNKGNKVPVQFPKHLENDYNRIIRKSIDAGESTERAARKAVKKLNETLETDQIYWRRGETYTKKTIGDYSTTYAIDFQTWQESEAEIAAAIRTGTDLVIIGGPLETDEICGKFAGKTFSLTGKTPGYPTLTQTPPYHPNCKHFLKLKTGGVDKINTRVGDINKREKANIERALQESFGGLAGNI